MSKPAEDYEAAKSHVRAARESLRKAIASANEVLAELEKV